MKAKILLTALCTFLLVNGKAFQRSSSLNIDVIEQPNKMYIVEVNNGTTYESYGDIKINHLPQGRARIKIFKRSIGNGRASQDKLVYAGGINIPHNSNVFSSLQNRALVVNSIVPKRTRTAGNRGGQFGMHPRIFRQLKQSVLNESFDSDRLQVLKSATRHNALSSHQVLDLMSLMSFDSYKLKFAKHAYRSTIDKRNYFIVRDGLTFTSSKRKLTEFINGCEGNQPKSGNKQRRGRR